MTKEMEVEVEDETASEKQKGQKCIYGANRLPLDALLRTCRLREMRGPSKQ